VKTVCFCLLNLWWYDSLEIIFGFEFLSSSFGWNYGKRKREEILLDTLGPFPLPLSSGPSVTHSSSLLLPSPPHGLGLDYGLARRNGYLSPSPSPSHQHVGPGVSFAPSDAPSVSVSVPPWLRLGVEEEKRTGDMLTTASHHPISPLLFSSAPQRVNAFREARAGTPPAPLTRPYLAPTSSEHERMWRRLAQRIDFS
jgi:hypothetical protein